MIRLINDNSLEKFKGYIFLSIKRIFHEICNSKITSSTAAGVVVAISGLDFT